MKNSGKYTNDEICKMFTLAELREAVYASTDYDEKADTRLNKSELVQYLFYDLDSLDEHYDLIETIQNTIK